MQDATSGDTYLFNQRLGELSRAERASLRKDSIAFLSQGDSPVDQLSIHEYLSAVEAADLGDFESRGDRRLSKLSGGERARIEIYKMLSLQRELLVFDEPTSQLDERQSARIAELLMQHASNGGVVIVSTRDDYLISCASRTLHLDYPSPN